MATALIAATLAAGFMPRSARAQLIVDYTFNTNTDVPDNGQMADIQTLGGLSVFSNVKVSLNLTSASGSTMWLGDLYSTLTFGTATEMNRTSVLLNRPGRDNTHIAGSSLSSLNVTLDDTAANNIWGTTSTTGTYKSDGRLTVNPAGPRQAFDGNDYDATLHPYGRNAGLSALNGSSFASNKFTLLMADYSLTNQAHLTAWGMTLTGTAAGSGTMAATNGTMAISDGAGTTNTLGASVTTTQNGSGGTLNVTLAGTTTFAGGVTGSGDLNKLGNGTLIISGAGSYTGATTVSAGILNIQNDTALGTTAGNTTVASGATLQLQGNISVAEPLTINGTGASGQNGAVVNVSDTNTLSGAITLGSASTISSDSGVLNISGNISGATFGLTLTGSGNGEASGVIGTTTGTLTKSGAGTWTLSGSSANTYTGLTTVSAGELDLNKTSGNAIAGDGNTATNDVTVSGGTLKWLQNEQVGNTATITLNSGTVNLNGKTETLGTFMNNGGTFSTGVGGHLIGTTATIDWTAGVNVVNADALVEDNHIKISGSGPNVVQGLAGGTVNAVSYGAGSTSGGILQLNSGGAGIEMTGASLVLNSDATSAGMLKFVGSPSMTSDLTAHASATTSTISSGGSATNPGAIDLGSATRTFTVETGGGSAAIGMSISAQMISPGGGLTKAGAGVLELTGANTYAGGTTVNNGTLLVNNTSGSGTGTGSVTVNNGGTLGGGNSTAIGGVSGAVTVASGGNLSPGNAAGSTAILKTGALTLQSGSFFNVDLNGTTAGSGYDQVIAASLAITGANLALTIGGTLNIGDQFFIALNSDTNAVSGTFAGFAEGATVTSGIDAFTISYMANGDGGMTANDILLTVTAVPEPSTWLAGGLALLTVLGMSRKRLARSLKPKLSPPITDNR